MIVVTGYLTIAPEQLDAALDAIRTCVTATRAEDGNVDYRYSHDIDQPNRLNIVEVWESEEAVQLHMGSEHMATFLTAIGGFIGGPVEITSHQVSESTKLF